MGGDTREYPDTGFLQTATTIAGIALALAAILERRGPEVDGRYLFQLGVLLAGLLAVISAIYAITDISRALNDLPDTPQPAGFRFLTASLIIIGGIYIAFLIDYAP